MEQGSPASSCCTGVSFAHPASSEAVSVPDNILYNMMAHLQSSVFKLSKDLIDSIYEEGIVAYTS